MPCMLHTVCRMSHVVRCLLHVACLAQADRPRRCRAELECSAAQRQGDHDGRGVLCALPSAPCQVQGHGCMLPRCHAVWDTNRVSRRAGYHAERDTMPSGIPCLVGYHALWDTMLHAEKWHVGRCGQRFCEAKMEEHANEIGRVIVANAHADGGELAILEGVCTDILEARLSAPPPCCCCWSLAVGRPAWRGTALARHKWLLPDR
jgi:hypothetical protein